VITRNPELGLEVKGFFFHTPVTNQEQNGDLKPLAWLGVIVVVVEVRIAALRPTQLNVGWREVRERAVRLERKSSAERSRYLARKFGRIVLGPDGSRHLIDGHHLALSILEARASNRMRAFVMADWSGLDPASFLESMQREGALYLFDRGRGPLDPSALPESVLGLTDDPYRSLAWAVRKAGGYGKWSASFSEFEWANFFRTRVEIGPGKRAFADAIRVATHLARSLEARGLPGFGAPTDAAA
jgi:hypothetical protein